MKHLTSMAAGALLGLSALAGPVLAQGSNASLTIVREVDSDRYDPQRSTARGASEIIFMMADTLVSLDHDVTSIKPGLASPWSLTPGPSCPRPPARPSPRETSS